MPYKAADRILSPGWELFGRLGHQPHSFGITIMKLRLLVLLGSLAFGTQACVAAPSSVKPGVSSASSTEDVLKVASKDDAAALKKKKKLAAEAKAKEKAKAAADAKAAKEKKLADKAKADAKKKQLAAAKAKADEKAKIAAKAKAEREKQLAAKRKADEEKKVARAKAAEERKIAQAQAAAERKAAREKAAEERKIARAKAAEERRLQQEAKAKAKEEQRLARLRAEEERRQQAAAAAEAARQAEIARLASMEVVQTGNNGELRSEVQEAPKQTDLFATLFGGAPVQKQSMLPETRALDAALELKTKKKFVVRPEFMPQEVQFSGYPRGTIVIDTAAHYLYLVEGSNRARRYAIAVGKDGLQYKGMVKVGDKQEWPRWIPTKEMQKREPAKYGKYADGMPGGGQNPLGARAIYLYENGRDTHLRIHGTIAPESIGTDSSNGCFRMINEHVMDLYRRVPVGTQVVVL